MTRRDPTAPIAALPDADDPIWLEGHDAVRAAYRAAPRGVTYWAYGERWSIRCSWRACWRNFMNYQEERDAYGRVVAEAVAGEIPWR